MFVVGCNDVADDVGLFAAGVLGDSLGALAHGMFGEFTGEEQTDAGLHFAARDGRSAVVVGQLSGLTSDTLEDVIDERVHDAHRLAADARVGVDLLQHLVDVDRVGLLPLALSLALTFRSLRLHGLL